MQQWEWWNTLRFFLNKWIYIKLLFQSLTFAILSASLCVKKSWEIRRKNTLFKKKKKKNHRQKIINVNSPRPAWDFAELSHLSKKLTWNYIRSKIKPDERIECFWSGLIFSCNGIHKRTESISKKPNWVSYLTFPHHEEGQNRWHIHKSSHTTRKKANWRPRYEKERTLTPVRSSEWRARQT